MVNVCKRPGRSVFGATNDRPPLRLVADACCEEARRLAGERAPHRQAIGDNARKPAAGEQLSVGAD
jgi:hypothetical protein